MRHPVRTLVLGLVVLVGMAAPSSAADESTTDRPSIALRLSPAVLDVGYQPGPSEHALRVDNVGSDSLHVVPELSEFTVTQDGTTRFEGPGEVAASSWVTLDTDGFELAPGQRRDVTVTVDVPPDAEPGERYVSVIFAVPAQDARGNISVTHRVAAKLYIEVPGEPIHRLELGPLTGPRLIDGGAATFELTVHNLGNAHRRFEDADRIVATAGNTEFPFQNFTILGSSTRVVEAVWPDPPLLCWCTIQAQVDDGQGELLVATARVIAFPLRLTGALLALATGLAMLIAGRRRARPRRATTPDHGPTAHREVSPAASLAPPAQHAQPQPRSEPSRPSSSRAHPAGPALTRPHGIAVASHRGRHDNRQQQHADAGGEADTGAQHAALDTTFYTAHGRGRHARRR